MSKIDKKTNQNNKKENTEDNLESKAESSRSKTWQIPFQVESSQLERINDMLRRDSTGGFLLLGAIVVAMLLANLPWSEYYFAVRDFEFGPSVLHLHLSVGEWASDGLLAIFFFLVGLELKKEFKIGDLRSPKRALVPVFGAMGGVITPAIIYLAVSGLDAVYVRGWAIPTATDIAIAVSVLALVAPNIPTALRLFLLTLATVDDLIAIVIIAVVYTESLNFLPLLIALLVFLAYRVLAVRYRRLFHRSIWLSVCVLVPIGAVAWALVHSSGIHSTIAGVVLGMLVPVEPEDSAEPCLSSEFEHKLRPFSSGVCLPIYAFFSAGVALAGAEEILAAVKSPVFIGVVIGLIVGKPIGIVAATWLVKKATRGALADGAKWIDMLGVGCLGGIGFTVSLLLSELSFTSVTEIDHAKVAVLLGSTISGILGAIILICRRNFYQELKTKKEKEQEKMDSQNESLGS